MGLSSIQDVSVWMLQALHSQTHGSAINVDPAGGSRGQEKPEDTNSKDSGQKVRLYTEGQNSHSEKVKRWLEHYYNYKFSHLETVKNF